MTRFLGLLAATFILFGLGVHGQAAPIVFLVRLDGPSESPPQASLGIGNAEVDLDVAAQTLKVHVAFGGLRGTTTASHIHATTTDPLTGTAGVATTTPSFTGFPLGVTDGVFDTTLDLTSASSYNPAFVTANGNSVPNAEQALISAIMTNRAYLNIHSSFAPGGEIRGFLTALPEPASIVSLSTGVLGACVIGWRMRRRPGK
jgi:hypothetical protein